MHIRILSIDVWVDCLKSDVNTSTLSNPIRTIHLFTRPPKSIISLYITHNLFNPTQFPLSNPNQNQNLKL